MLNPWISLSFQAARLGWQAHDAMVDGFFRLASGNASNLSEPLQMPDKQMTATEASDGGSTVPVEATASRSVEQKVVQIHRKARRRSKRRHSK
jgi:hypothetical protein